MPFFPWVSCGGASADPDLWGFCGGAVGMLATALLASRMIDDSASVRITAVTDSPAWIAHWQWLTH